MRVDIWHLISWSCSRTLCEGGVRGSATLLEAGSGQAALSLRQEMGGEGQGSSNGQRGSTFSPRGQKCRHLTHSSRQNGSWTGWGLQTAVRRGTVGGTDHNTYRNRHRNREEIRFCISDRVWINMCYFTYVWHTNMEGCTGGNGPTLQQEYVYGKWWWEGAGAPEFVLPPPPPGPWVAPLRWCSSRAGCWVKWSGSRAVCSGWPPLETPHAETEGVGLLATDWQNTQGVQYLPLVY